MATEVKKRVPQAERRARTLAKVLRAAAAVFAKRGYHDSSLDEIGERAGLSKGSVYYNFASKQELFLAVLEERIGESLEDVRRALSSDQPRGRQARVAGASFLERVGADPRWGPLFFEFLVYAARDRTARPAFAAWLLGTRDALEDLLARRFEAIGTDPPLPPRELAIVVSALANGMLIERMFDREGVPADLLGRVIALLAGGERR